MARLKPNPHIVVDRAQAEGALAEMAALDRKIAAAEADMQEAIDNAKALAAQACAPLAARRKELADAVAVYAKLNRAELFRTAKSLDMGFGCSTKVVQINGVTPEMTLERLRQYNLTDGIRTKEEINKEAALGWPDERLELVGLRRRTADAFFIEIKKDSVPDGGSGAAALERAS